MNEAKKINMSNPNPRYRGLDMRVDPIDRPISQGDDNAMALFWEEQPLMFELFEKLIADRIKNVPGSIDYADIGTGSGIWSLLVKKEIPGAKNVLAIDINDRALSIAKGNAERNAISGIQFSHQRYSEDTMPPRSAKVIGLYPPYHPYPPHLKDTDTFPKHADGGPDGQDVFKDQLRIADHHLAEGGSIIFNQMCVGRNGKPDFVDYIPQLMSGSSLTYYNIYEPIDTRVFLKEVYGDKHPEWQEDFSQKNPQIFYCNGAITRDGNAGKVTVYDRSLDHRAEGTSWKDRFELHKKIAEHD